MEINTLSYEKMVEDALRGVLRQALQITEAQGLPGSHHFYITFDTTHPGVKMADSLKALHPSEMTIVLQHQFWDLKVSEEKFEITLSFSGVSQRLCIPFAAVTAFADPHAKFGLQFHVEFDERSSADEDAEARDNDDAEAMPVDSARVSHKARESGRKGPHLKVSGGKAAADDPAAGNVVTLDTFRKK